MAEERSLTNPRGHGRTGTVVRPVATPGMSWRSREKFHGGGYYPRSRGLVCEEGGHCIPRGRPARWRVGHLRRRNARRKRQHLALRFLLKRVGIDEQLGDDSGTDD